MFRTQTSRFTTRNDDQFGRRFKLVQLASVAIIAAVFAIIVGGIGFGIYASNQVSTVDACVVTDKDRTTNQDGQSQMRIYTENCGVFTVQDNPIHMVFNSADIYGSIQVGETYDFEVYGFRIPILSQFPSILEATPSN